MGVPVARVYVAGAAPLTSAEPVAKRHGLIPTDAVRGVLGWDPNLSIWVTAGIVGIYTISGGLTAVVMTDVLQLVIMFLGGGVLVNSTENLRLWMKNPQAIKPGSKMPDFNLSDQHVRQIVAYLESLD